MGNAAILIDMLSVVAWEHPVGASRENPVAPRSLSVLPIAMYDSDIGIGIGAKAVLRNGARRDESLDGLLFFSSKGEQWYVLTGSMPDQELRQGRRFNLAVDVKLEFDKLLKSNYFGLGNATAEDDHQFPKEFATAQIILSRSPHPRLIGELLWRYTHYAVYGFDGSWGTINADTPGAGDHAVAAAGFRLRLDGRDSTIRTRRGWRLMAGVELATPTLGSDWDFTTYRVESSVYRSIARDHILAARLWLQHVEGHAPYMELSKIGDSWTVRGFKADRFLDGAMVLGSLEYRFPLYWKLGGVLFGDAGRVGRDLGALGLDSLHSDAGIGMRLYLANFVTRLDVGSSTEGTRIFLQFGHVF